MERERWYINVRENRYKDDFGKTCKVKTLEIYDAKKRILYKLVDRTDIKTLAVNFSTNYVDEDDEKEHKSKILFFKKLEEIRSDVNNYDKMKSIGLDVKMYNYDIVVWFWGKKGKEGLTLQTTLKKR